MELFKELFNWIEISQISKATIPTLAEAIGVHLTPEEISLKSEFSKVKNFTVLSYGKNPLFYIKKVWEYGSIKEVIALELSRFFDPDLGIENYLLITMPAGKFIKKTDAYLMTTWLSGNPIKNKNHALNFPFAFGRQYEFGRWLCLYDCYPKHYFVAENQQVRRIDFGLGFSKLGKAYEGFTDIWPKALFNHPEFIRGRKYESALINMRFEVIQEEILDFVEKLRRLVVDDVVDFLGKLFVPDLLKYWANEGFINKAGRLAHYQFLHSLSDPTSSSSP